MTTQKQNYGEKANKLSSELWEMANVLRGNIDSSKFKDYIFGIIFTVSCLKGRSRSKKCSGR